MKNQNQYYRHDLRNDAEEINEQLQNVMNDENPEVTGDPSETGGSNGPEEEDDGNGEFDSMPANPDREDSLDDDDLDNEDLDLNEEDSLPVEPDGEGDDLQDEDVDDES